MRHKISGRRLNRTSAHRMALIKNLITSLLHHERIETTREKAKELRRAVEKTITLAKRGKPNAHREVFKVIKDKDIITKLFDDITKRVASRNGGYTRIIHVGNRRGDCAPMSVIELVDRLEEKKTEKKKKGGNKAAEEKAAA